MSSLMLKPALSYAAQGWPVFPCNPRNKQPYLATDKDPVTAKPIKGTGGVSKAVTAPVQIETWWKRWPQAMIGLATGHERLFVLDFDPRTDAATGEVYDLAGLKAALEAQMGCPLPESRTAITQSGGVHVYLTWPDDGGTEIRNRGNLPLHVDVRGKGGYVIAPPSVMDSGKAYRWMNGRGEDHAIAEAPAALVAILRAPKARVEAGVQSSDAPAGQNSDMPTPNPSRKREGSEEGRAGSAGDPVAAAIAKYADAALMGELRAVRNAGSGQRNAQLNESAYAIASLVAADALDAGMARSMLEAAARDNPGRDDDGQLIATIASGWDAGMAAPRDLTSIRAEAEARAARYQRGQKNGRTGASGQDRNTSGAASAGAASPSTPLSAPHPADTPNGKPSSRQGGARRGVEPEGGWGPEIVRECAFKPLTDLGNLERFIARYGGDFRYVEAWGWLAWDGQRWNRELANALLGQAIQSTMRQIQTEAEWMHSTGVLYERYPSQEAIAKVTARMGNRVWYWRDGHDVVASDGEVMDEDRVKRIHDRVLQIKTDGSVVLRSDKLGTWGRTSEGAGHIKCIDSDTMARAAECMVALSDDFDRDPLRLNVQNGTIVFERAEGGANPSGSRASARLEPHAREDLITKIAQASWLPGGEGNEGAVCKRYDAYLERVQPDVEMRHFLDCWSGYNALGDVSAQVFALFYGQGANGKSVWVDVHAHILGDYARVCGIETFIDQGRYRKGSDATPDLAALAGRRMVRASEPEEGAKFSDGLIKALTGTEPMPVRELNRPPFEMNVTFKATISANMKPRIGTDHGIQRRVRLVPWDVILPDEEQDKQLLGKLKAEADGILGRMVEGAIAYLGNGLPLPGAIEDATREYKEENDLLGRFLTDNVEPAKGETVTAAALHALFAAWQGFVSELDAQGKPWTPKRVALQMKKKGYKQTKSSSMLWVDIRTTKEEREYSQDKGGGMYDQAPPWDGDDDVAL